MNSFYSLPANKYGAENARMVSFINPETGNAAIWTKVPLGSAALVSVDGHRFELVDAKSSHESPDLTVRGLAAQIQELDGADTLVLMWDDDQPQVHLVDLRCVRAASISDGDLRVDLGGRGMLRVSESAAWLGLAVKLCSLVARPELNGRSGRVVNVDARGGRLGVRIDGEERPLGLKPENLEREDDGGDGGLRAACEAAVELKLVVRKRTYCRDAYVPTILKPVFDIASQAAAAPMDTGQAAPMDTD